MARLRHFAICVGNLEAAAKFYGTVFDLKEVGRETIRIGSAIYMSDGVINLALLNFAGDEGGGVKDARNFIGSNHFGFQVDDLVEAQKEDRGRGRHVLFRSRQRRARATSSASSADPDGIVFDISHHGWVGTDSYTRTKA